MAHVGIGVIGLGRMGQVYALHTARQIAEATLVAVADPDQTALNGLSEQASDAKTFLDYHDLLADPQVQGVIIASPTSTHPDIVIAAAKAGKAIFCEKPLALNLPETDEIIKVVEQAGVPLQVGFMRRFDKGYRVAKQQIDAGIIGQQVAISSIGRDPYRTSLEYADPNISGGLIVDMAIHDVDCMHWLMADSIQRVYTEAAALVYPELLTVGDVDTATINCRFEGGGLGSVEVSRTAIYGYDIRCEVVGTKGTLQIGYLRETPLMIMTKNGITHDVVPHFPERFGPAYVAQIEHFVDCLLHDRPPQVTAEDARAALEVCVAATLSQHEERVVTVAEVKSR